MTDKLDEKRLIERKLIESTVLLPTRTRLLLSDGHR